MANEASNRLQRSRNAHGLCWNCNDPATDGTHCANHADSNRQNTKRRRNYRKANGLCVQCGETATGVIQLCVPCRDKINARKHERYQPKPPRPRMTYSEAAKRARAKLREAGLCCWCRNPSDGMALCVECRDKNYERVKARKAARSG